MTRRQPDENDYWAIAIWAILIVFFCLAVCERNTVTFDGHELSGLTIMAGCMLGLMCAVTYYFRLRQRWTQGSVPVNPVPYGQALQLSLIVGVMLAPGATYINREFAGDARESTVTVVHKTFIDHPRGPDTISLSVRFSTGDIKDLPVDSLFWNRVEVGDQLQLQLRRGALGYDVVTALSVVTN